MIKVFLGIDVGTTKLKLTLMNREGEIIWKDSTNIHPIFGKNGEVEINPYDWIDALKKLSRNFDLSNVEAIGLSGQMHSLILIDKSGEPVRKAILWSDGRGKEIQAELEESYGREILERCGSFPFLSFTLVKLIYLLRNEKSSVERACKFCLSKDFVGGWLTSNYNTEKTDASATLMMDIDRCEWCVNEILGGEIPDRIFPEIHDSMEVRGYLRKEAAEELKLPAGIPVIYGAGDQEAAAYGVGVIHPGRIMFSLSTGSQIFTPVEERIVDERIHNFRHIEGIHIMGAVQNCGFSLNWAMKTFGFRDFEELNENAVNSSPGSNGVTFLPYIIPERTPIMSSDVSGNLLNFKVGNTRYDIARALIEGTVFTALDAWKVIQEFSMSSDERKHDVVILGGVARNSIVREILSSFIKGRLKFVREDFDSSSYGAALMAARAMGYLEGVEPYEKFLERTIESVGSEEYLECFERFINLRKKMFGI